MLIKKENPLNKPYRETGKPQEKLFFILVFGLFIFLFLFVFGPFGLAQLKKVDQFLISLGFGLVTAFMLVIFIFLLEPVVIRGNWTLGKNILWDIVIASSIGVANYFYMSIIFPHMFIFRYLLYSVWTAILVGIIPVTVSYIISYNKMYKTALKKAAIPAVEIFPEEEVLIRAGNPKNEFRCDPKSIVYLCSNDNYVTIVTIRGDTTGKTTIRGTLKSAETELRKNSMFVRCHKCYIVNMDYVERVTGHNQNMKIRLLPAGSDIPVSRSKADLINKKIKKS